VALAQVSSDWTVTEGEIALTIAQFSSAVTGRFDDWTAAITLDESATGVLGNVETTIAIGSLSLGSATNKTLELDFFNAAAFPTATFTAQITADGDGYLADGALTVKDIEIPVALPVTLNLDGDEVQMAGQVTIDRRSFNVGQSMSDESNLAFAVEVEVAISLSVTRGK
jgi:polyisoprenoid-binding protein YceI